MLTLQEKLSIRSIAHFALVLEEQYSLAKIHLLHEEELIAQVSRPPAPHGPAGALPPGSRGQRGAEGAKSCRCHQRGELSPAPSAAIHLCHGVHPHPWGSGTWGASCPEWSAHTQSSTRGLALPGPCRAVVGDILCAACHIGPSTETV